MRAIPLTLLIPILMACGEATEPQPGPDQPSSCTDGACIGEAWTSQGQFGDPCEAAESCMSGLCGQDSVTGQMFCTQLCSDQEPCPLEAGCFPTGNGEEQVCGPPGG